MTKLSLKILVTTFFFGKIMKRLDLHPAHRLFFTFFFLCLFPFIKNIEIIAIYSSLLFLLNTTTFFNHTFKAFLFALPYFFLNFFWTGQDYSISIANFFRIFFLCLVSFSSLGLEEIEKIFLYLMQRKIIPIEIGYAILSGLNSLQDLKQHFFRVRACAKMRKKRPSPLFLLFPVLVYSLSKAQIMAFSMKSKGINSQKIFYFDYLPTKKQNKSCLVFLSFILIIECGRRFLHLYHGTL